MAIVMLLLFVFARANGEGPAMKRAGSALASTRSRRILFLHVPLLILAVFSFNSLALHRLGRLLAALVLGRVSRSAAGRSAPGTAWSSPSSPRSFPPSSARCAPTACGSATRRLLAGSLYLSLVTPEIVTGISLLAFFQWIFRFLHVQLGMHTVILAHVAFSIAYVVIVVMARLRTVDATLEEAALDLGANEWQAFRYVTLPAILPGVIAAALLAFTVSFDDYVITSLVAGVDSETLPMVIYAMARRGVNPVVNAISALIVVGLGALILISERLRTT